MDDDSCKALCAGIYAGFVIGGIGVVVQFAYLFITGDPMF